ncbi:MAG: autotransporter outer membrane beta-barrel domain-containing protein [Legionella sp.]|uniref:autotransporter family protein n=1 Tax=Legionella sp. TaxID=459 RepID=UPI0028453502|nr:autotransporter outer membrane beta-barrel domain-containing protein [Legionella sp.]
MQTILVLPNVFHYAIVIALLPISSIAATVGPGTITSTVTVSSGGTTSIVSNTTIQPSTSGARGVNVTNGTVEIAGTNVQVVTNGNSGYGFNIDSSVNASFFRSNAGSQLTISTSGLTRGYGIWATGVSKIAGTPVVSLLNAMITTIGNGASGIVLANGADGVLSGLHINTSGGRDPGNNNAGAYGLNAQGGSQITFDNVEIRTTGIGGAALVNSSLSRMFGSQLSLSTFGDAAHATNTQTGANTQLNNSTIHTEGEVALGIWVNCAGCSLTTSSTFTGGTLNVETLGVGSFGVMTQSQSQASITGLQLSTLGSDAYGLYASGVASNLTVDSANILTSGTSAFGGIAFNGAHLIVENSQITTQETSAVGLMSQASSSDSSSTIAEISNSSITTLGGQAHALSIQEGGTLIASNSIIRAQGNLAAGLLITSTTGFTANASITGGSLTSTQGAGIGIINGVANIELNNTSVSGNNFWLIAGQSAGVAAPGIALPPADNDSIPTTTFVVKGRLKSAHQLIAPAAIVTITSSGSVLNGAAFTEAGNITNVALENNTLWNLTGSSNLTNLTNSLSLIDFSLPTQNGYKTLTINNYVGGNGLMRLNTFLQETGSPSDLLVVDGGTATGATRLIIRNSGGKGAITVGDGILVVEAINEGVTDSAAFSLAAPAIAGPYEYSLYRSGINGDNENNWYLRSICPLTNPNCSSEPPPPGPPSPANYRSEVGLYPVLPAMTLLYGQALIDTLHQRVGQGKWPTDAVTSANASPRVWGRVLGMHGDRNRINSNRFLRSSHYDYNFAALQIGGDLYEGSTAKGTRNHLGVYGAFGRGTGGVERPHLYLGSNEFTGYTMGGYWTVYSPMEAYIDTVLQATWYSEARSQSYRIPALETSGWGLAASIESGYPFTFKQQWIVEPQGQLVYQSINLDNGQDIGAIIRFKNNDSLAGRLGVRFANKHVFNNNEEKTLTTWFRPNFWYQFRGNPQAQFSSAAGYIPFQSQLEGSTLELNLGTTLDLPRNMSLYANGSYGVGLNLHANTYNGQLGFKVRLV